MDDPVETHYLVNNGKPQKYKGKRVYYIQLIASISQGEKNRNEKLFYYKLALNQKGIMRIEHVKSESY